LIWVGYGHPYQNGGRILEQRHVMERALGRYLEPGEVVHHINGDKQDNRLENLELMTQSDHMKLHHINYKPKQIMLTCEECGKEFKVKPSRANIMDPKSQRKHCSRECDDKARSKRMKQWWAERRKAK